MSQLNEDPPTKPARSPSKIYYGRDISAQELKKAAERATADVDKDWVKFQIPISLEKKRGQHHHLDETSDDDDDDDDLYTEFDGFTHL